MSSPYEVTERVQFGVRLIRQMERADALAQRLGAQALILYSLEAELEAQVTAVYLSRPSLLHFYIYCRDYYYTRDIHDRSWRLIKSSRSSRLSGNEESKLRRQWTNG